MSGQNDELHLLIEELLNVNAPGAYTEIPPVGCTGRLTPQAGLTATH